MREPVDGVEVEGVEVEGVFVSSTDWVCSLICLPIGIWCRVAWLRVRPKRAMECQWHGKARSLGVV